MGKIHEIVRRFSGSLTMDQIYELRNTLQKVSPNELSTVDEHRLFIELLANFRRTNLLAMRMTGANFVSILEELLGVGGNSIYSNKLRFVYELIQNVDDCDYVDRNDCHLEVKFEYNKEPGRIIFTYNEKGFTPENVFAITGIAEASKSISADKVEIGEKGIGFKSVFGIADKVLIQSGMFSFEFTKENFIVPVARYKNFKPVKGTMLELQMPAVSCKNIFVELVKEYKNKDALLCKNPILFLNKLTHLKMYFDGYRYIEFDVQRGIPQKHGNLLLDQEAVLSVDMQFHDSTYEVSPYTEEIKCFRYTMPVLYGESACLSRYGANTRLKEKLHNISAVFPITKDGMPISKGILYSFLPTQVKISAPLILHVPFKLHGSREYVDPQEKNEWFEYTIERLSDFVKAVYIDLASLVKQDIVRYIPPNNSYFFQRDGEKVECLRIDGLRGSDVYKERVFYTENNRFVCADGIIAFGNNELIDDPVEVYMLLGEKLDLFIPPASVDMKLYGCDIIEDVITKLFRKGLRDNSSFEEIISWLEKNGRNIDYALLLSEAGSPIILSSNQLSIITKYPKLERAFLQVARMSIRANKKPPFHIDENIERLSPEISKRIQSLVHDADLSKIFEAYMDSVAFNFFAVECKRDFAIAADNGVALAKGAELGSFSTLSAFQDFDPRKTFSASLIISQASEQLNSFDDDDTLDNSEYLRLLRGVRQSLRRAFSDRAYANYVRAIAEAGTDRNRFLSELLQNADDCEYARGIIPEFTLLKNDNFLAISYNETGFSKANVRALTAIGESTKKQMQSGENFSIGEKGVGFKSVFGVAKTVEIHSNGFDFKLTDELPTIPAKCQSYKNLSGTKMLFEMKVDVQSSFISERILRLCTCLHNLKKIHISGHDVEITDDNSKRTIRIDDQIFSFERIIHKFTVTDQAALEARNEYGRTIRPDQEIILYVPESSKEREYYVYAGLPIEIKSLVPLVIDAPFELTTSREGILKNRWNERIREELYNAVILLIQLKGNLGLDVLRYVGFRSKDGSNTWKNFDNEFLNEYNWAQSLKALAFIPILGSDQRVSISDGQCVLIPEFIAKIQRADILVAAFGRFAVNCTGKSQYTQLLEAIGCRKARSHEIFEFLQKNMSEFIVNDEFRKGLYDYLSGKQGNLAFDSIGERVVQLPLFPIKMKSGTRYVPYADSIFTNDSMFSDKKHQILETKIMSIELADRILPGNKRIEKLTQQVYDAEYRENLESMIRGTSGTATDREIAEYLRNEFTYNRAAFIKCESTLIGLSDQIPLLMLDGQYKREDKYLNSREQWYGGALVKHMIVHPSFAELAEFLKLKEIERVHADAFGFHIEDVSDEDIADIQYLDNSHEILKHLYYEGLISDEQDERYNLGFINEDDNDDYDDEDFPEKPVMNPDKIRAHILELSKYKNPYIEKPFVRWQPAVTFEKGNYSKHSYGRGHNSDKCFCQMCQKKFHRKYIEHNNIERHPAYAWEQMYLSLCLHCSKDFISLRNSDYWWRIFINKIMGIDISTTQGLYRISISSDKAIYFTAVHLAEIQEIFNVQGWGDKAPKRTASLGKTVEDDD